LDGAIILLYHRVTRPDRDPQLLCVSPENFAAQLEALGRMRRVIPLSELARDLRRGHVKPGTAAITFDDGYADNIHEAAPILRRFGMPATVFATTAHAEDGLEFFWDDLDRIFLSPGRLPARGRLQWEDGGFEIDLAQAAADSQAEAGGYARWTILDKIDPTPRHRAYRELCQLLHRAPIARRQLLLDQLQSWSGAARRTSCRMMTPAEMSQLSADGLIDIGGHTVDHPVLRAESPEVQRQQIVDNKATLESIVGRPIISFSYPFGTRHDYSPETIAIVRESGYEFACANVAGNVTGASDPYRLSRCIVRNWAADEFHSQLTRAGRPLTDGPVVARASRPC